MKNANNTQNLGQNGTANDGGGIGEIFTGAAGALGLGGTDIANSVLGEGTVDNATQIMQEKLGAVEQAADGAGMGGIFDRVINIAESVTGIDLNGDGVVGEEGQ